MPLQHSQMQRSFSPWTSVHSIILVLPVLVTMLALSKKLPPLWQEVWNPEASSQYHILGRSQNWSLNQSKTYFHTLSLRQLSYAECVTSATHPIHHLEPWIGFREVVAQLDVNLLLRFLKMQCSVFKRKLCILPKAMKILALNSVCALNIYKRLHLRCDNSFWEVSIRIDQNNLLPQVLCLFSNFPQPLSIPGYIINVTDVKEIIFSLLRATETLSQYLFFSCYSLNIFIYEELAQLLYNTECLCLPVRLYIRPLKLVG